MTSDIVILSGACTPFGSFAGGLIAFSATDLAVIATESALDRAGVAPTDVDYVVMGNVCQTSRDAIYMGRHVALKSGMKTETPALIINQLCGSGVQAVVQAANLIETGQAQ